MEMADYIERTPELILAVNAGARAIENTKKYHGAFYLRDIFADEKIAYVAAAKLLRSVEDIPAADVAPVVHGRWLKPHWALGRQRVCSVCHNTVRMPSFDSGEYAEYPGCPWCLAKMDGDDADRGGG